MKQQIKSWKTGEVLLEGEAESIRDLINQNKDKRINLRNADLRNADLRGSNLRGVNLRNADLRNADLRGVDLSDADLRGVEGTFIFNWGVKLKVVEDEN